MKNHILVIESRGIESVLYCNHVPVVSLSSDYDGLSSYNLNGWLMKGENIVSLEVTGSSTQKKYDSPGQKNSVTGQLFALSQQDISLTNIDPVLRFQWKSCRGQSENNTDALPFVDQFAFVTDCNQFNGNWQQYNSVTCLNKKDKQEIVSIVMTYFIKLLHSNRQELKHFLSHKLSRLKRCRYIDTDTYLDQYLGLGSKQKNILQYLQQLDYLDFRFLSAMAGKAIVVSNPIMANALQSQGAGSINGMWADGPVCVARTEGQWCLVN